MSRLFHRLFDEHNHEGCDPTVSVHTPGFFENGGVGTASAACSECTPALLRLFAECGEPADITPLGAGRKTEAVR
jgi:hypothetical protein